MEPDPRLVAALYVFLATRILVAACVTVAVFKRLDAGRLAWRW